MMSKTAWKKWQRRNADRLVGVKPEVAAAARALLAGGSDPFAQLDVEAVIAACNVAGKVIENAIRRDPLERHNRLAVLSLILAEVVGVFAKGTASHEALTFGLLARAGELLCELDDGSIIIRRFQASVFRYRAIALARYRQDFAGEITAEEEAIRILDALVKEGVRESEIPTVIALVDLGTAYSDTGEWPMARDTYRRALSLVEAVLNRDGQTAQTALWRATARAYLADALVVTGGSREAAQAATGLTKRDVELLKSLALKGDEVAGRGYREAQAILGEVIYVRPLIRKEGGMEIIEMGIIG